MRLKILKLLQAFLFAFIYSQPAIAADDFEALDNSMVSISGFGSLFVTQAGESGLGYYREYPNFPQNSNLSLTTDSNLGFQVTADPSPQLSATLQFVYKDTLEKDIKESIEWANIKYKATPNIDIRMGRMGLDLHMLSEYRNVGFAYLWVRPIVEFYTPVIFDYVDGLDISYTKELDSGSIQYKGFYGITKSTGLQSDGNLSKIESDLYGASILFESQQWKLRGAIASGNVRSVNSSVISTTLKQLNLIKFGFPSGTWPNLNELIDVVNPNDAKITYYSLGFSYDDEIQIQSEISYTPIQGWGIVPSTYSAYISLAKSFDEITPFIVASAVKVKGSVYQISSPAPVPALQQFKNIMQNEFNAGMTNQKTVSLGVRWDIRNNLALKAQWDHTIINNRESALWNNAGYLTAPETMNTFSMGLNFIF